jgi:hypothetical protein
VTDTPDVENFLAVFDEYAENSGVLLNRNKSTELIFESWRQSNGHTGHSQWATDGTKFLGVLLGNDPVEERRWVECDLIERVRIVRWEHVVGRLSSRGRVRVANQLIAPEIWQSLHHVQIGTAGVRALQSALVNFTWGGGKHWVNVAMLCAPVLQGSLGQGNVADKASAFRFHCLQRHITTGEEDPKKAVWASPKLIHSYSILKSPSFLFLFRRSLIFLE